MANWYGTARSNYFRVKDAGAFTAWTTRRGLGVFTKETQPGVFAIHPEDSGADGSWPSYDVEHGDDIDLTAELAKHLEDGEVAVLLQSGAEKLRYITGYALAVNAKGRVVSLTLDEIYRKAARQFRVPEEQISRAEY